MPPASPANSARRMEIFLVFLGAVVYAIHASIALSTSNLLVDFGGLYFPARTLLHHADPYNPAIVLHEFRAQVPIGPDQDSARITGTNYPYPPTLFVLTTPFALLPWGLAKLLWTLAGFSTLLTASWLLLDSGGQWHSRIPGFLIAFELINSETLTGSGNGACLAIALCIIGAWCFLEQRCLAVGVACLASSLILKPQDAGLIWLYFLLAGHIYRKRALQSLFLALALGLASLIWTAQVSPDWLREMARNLAVYTRIGGVNDPGPTSRSIAGFIIDLQTVFSLIRNDSRFYNLATYLICGALIGLWAGLALRSRSISHKEAWLALAAISAFTLLVVYHRRYDTKILLLAIPACAILRNEGGRIGRWALSVTGACFLFTGDGLWVFTSKLLDNLQSGHPTLFHFLQITLVVMPAPLSILTMGVFYLWVLLSGSRRAGAIENRGLRPEASFIDESIPGV
jgi:hypothetical protein